MNFGIIPIGLKKLGSVLSKNAPMLLNVLGGGGLITTVVFAVKATPKAVKLLDERKEKEQKEKLSKAEVVETCWKTYLPTIGMAGLTLLCFFGAQGINASRQAAIAGLYSMTRKDLEAYQAKIEEKFGPKEAEDVRNKISAERMAKVDVSPQSLIMTGTGDTIFIEDITEQAIVSSLPKIYEAQAEISQKIEDEKMVEVNEWFKKIGLPVTILGEKLFWSKENPLLVKCDRVDPRLPYLYITYKYLPMDKYELSCL